MKPKICIIGTLKFGIGHYIAHLYPELQDDYDLRTITFSHGSPGDKFEFDDQLISKNIPDFTACINPHGLLDSKKSIESLFEFFEKENFQILNLHVSSYTRKSAHIFIPLIEYFKRKGLKVAYTIHDVLPTPESGEVTSYLKYFYNLADIAIVGNDNEEDDLKKIFDFKKTIFTAKHGVYLGLNQNKISQEKARQILKIPKDKKVILFFGILRENKGLDYLINAINKLKNDYLLIISVSQRLGFRLNKYLELIDKLELHKYVKIIKDDESTLDEIEIYFQSSDLVCLPYTSNSQSGILNLAFAFKKPVVLTEKFAESKEIDGKMGFVARAKDADSLELMISRFFQLNKDELSKFKDNIDRYNEENSFSKTSQIYKDAFNYLLQK